MRAAAAPLFGLASLLALAPTAFGQAVERHTPPSDQGHVNPFEMPNAVPEEENDAPIGPELKSLVVILGSQSLKSNVPYGVDFSSAPRLVGAEADVNADLAPFLGRKISRKLIAEIEASLARRYRILGYPLVSLSTPEQQIGQGVLHVRVTEFKIGELSVLGLGKQEADPLKARVGLKTGDAINAAALGDELAWLNHYPFRRVQAVFKPSETVGATDILLSASALKPWQAFAGYDNSGSPSSTLDRYQAGVEIGNMFGHDSVVSIQLTGSRDALGSSEHPQYASEAISYAVPVGHRAQIDASYDHIETNQTAGLFPTRLKTDEGNFELRFGAPFLLSATSQSDFRLGFSIKHQELITLFDGVAVNDVPLEDFALIGAYHFQHQTDDRSTALDFTLHAAPGRIDPADADKQERLFSQGRANKARYAYATLYLDSSQKITPSLDWRFQLVGQWSPQALPRTEQSGLGGVALVRGYTLDSGSFDTAIILRNQLAVSPPAGGHAPLQPFVFVDCGQGRDMHLKTNTELASVGAGLDGILLQHALVNVTAANVLATDHGVRAGSFKIEASFLVKF